MQGDKVKLQSFDSSPTVKIIFTTQFGQCRKHLKKNKNDFELHQSDMTIIVLWCIDKVI